MNHIYPKGIGVLRSVYKLLDKLSSGKSSVSLIVSEEDPHEAGFEKLTKLIETPLVGGATYWSKYFPIWLCDVTRFVYDGRMPDTLFYKADKTCQD